MTSANDRSRREKKKKRRKKKDALATFLYQRSLAMISLNDYVHHLLRAVNENCTFRKSLQQCVNYRRKNHLWLFLFLFAFLPNRFLSFISSTHIIKILILFNEQWYLKRSIFKWNFTIFLCFQRVVFSCIKILQLNIVPSYCWAFVFLSKEINEI